MNNYLVERYKKAHGYSWVNPEKDEQFGVVAEMVVNDLNSIYGAELDFEGQNSEYTSLALMGMEYYFANAYDDFKKNYQSELIALSNEGRVLNAEIEGII